MRCDLPGYLVVLKLFTLLHMGVCGIGVPAFSSPGSSSAACVKSATWVRCKDVVEQPDPYRHGYAFMPKALIAVLYLVQLGVRVRRPSLANSTRGRDLIHRLFHRRIAERKPVLQQMNVQQGF